MFKCCVVLAVHGHHYVHVFGLATGIKARGAGRAGRGSAAAGLGEGKGGGTDEGAPAA